MDNRRRLTLAEKFTSDKYTVDPKTGCWEWKGYSFSNGYGCIMYAPTGKRRGLLAHRVSYELNLGEIPEGLCVCHKCDNPKCVNPEHLFLGTHKENLEDMRAKGRAVYYKRDGEKNPAAKLTESDVREIRARYRPREVTCKDLASIFNVSVPLIEKILARKVWKYVQ